MAIESTRAPPSLFFVVLIGVELLLLALTKLRTGAKLVKDPFRNRDAETPKRGRDLVSGRNGAPGVGATGGVRSRGHRSAVPPQPLPTDAAERRWHRGILLGSWPGAGGLHVAERAAAFLARPLGELRLITLHRGNVASVAADRCIDTSMRYRRQFGHRCLRVEPGFRSSWRAFRLGGVTNQSKSSRGGQIDRTLPPVGMRRETREFLLTDTWDIRFT